MARKPKLPEEQIKLVTQQTKRKIYEIHGLLAPDIQGKPGGPITAQSVSARLKEMPKHEREMFRLKTALALADLTALQDSLHEYRDLIAGEIRQHLSARSAATAYVKLQGNIKNRRVG